MARLSYNPYIYLCSFQFHCCGLNSSSDWNPYVPKTCCAPGATECLPLLNAYSTGCSGEIRNFLGDSSVWFGTTALVVAGVEVNIYNFA